MKWRIKNPSPNDPRWGDFHLGNSLAKYLRRLGQEVVTDFHGDWDHQADKDADVILVLRGRYPYRVTGNAFHIMWHISHPDMVGVREYLPYDLVYVASNQYVRELQARMDKPVSPLLQATDHELFYPRPFTARGGVAFVGNTRHIHRPAVVWTAAMDIPLRVWGTGWNSWIPKNRIAGTYLENDRLIDVYTSADVVLNDHWSDMRAHGFVNNRVFDVLACGTPLISDFHEELFELFPDEILYFRNKKELEDHIKGIEERTSSVRQAAARAAVRVANEFSLEARALQMVTDVHKNLGSDHSSLHGVVGGREWST